MKEKINDRLIVIIGIPGSGKTTLATELALLQSKFTEIRANYAIRIPNYIPLKIEELEMLNTYIKPNLVIFDEGYTVIDSRNAMSSLNKYLSYKTFQSRKTVTRYVLTAQIKGSLDNRFRELAGIVIKAKAVLNGYFYQVYHNIEKNGSRVLKKKKSWMITYKKAEKIYPYFDTTEIVMSDSVKDTVARNMSRESVLLLSEKLAKKLIELKPKWSLRAVEGYLFENKQSKVFAKPIYYALEKMILERKKQEKLQKEIKEREKKKEELKKKKEKEFKEKERLKDLNFYG